MSQWGAVKLGLVVAVAGSMGALGLSKASGRVSRGNFGALQGMIAGSAAKLESSGAFGRGGGGADYGLMKAAGFPTPQELQGSPAAGQPVRKIVRTASLCFEVKEQSTARALVRAAVYRNGATIFSDETSGAGDNQSGVIVIQTPPEKLDAVLKELEPLGRVLSRSVSSENMSEEYVDLRSRLENSRKVEKRLTELLAFRTNKLGDVLQVEHELERVGADIERTLGRMKYIDALRRALASPCACSSRASSRRTRRPAS